MSSSTAPPPPVVKKESPEAHVSDPAMEFLLQAVLQWVEQHSAAAAATRNNSAGGGGGGGGGPVVDASTVEQNAILAAEMAAAKLERMGYSVGFRLCERLAQNKTFGTVVKDPSQAVAASQLEAVKFLCKEFWMEVFRKQIDKLQTNHRGVFVLKDMELGWLSRLPPNQEEARVAAIQLLAFPCGLVRGALANLGIPAVVSCDFLSDGATMAACSFNVKIK